MSRAKKSAPANSVDKQQKTASPNSSPSNSPSSAEESAQPAAPKLTAIEVAQLSEADLRALIQAQVAEERQSIWEQTKKNYPNKDNAPKRLRDDLETPPPPVMVWQA